MRIAILGGGVAGVSSAIAFRQKGFDVSIYERHGSASTIGAGIVVWPNAAYVLEQLGVLSEIEAVSGRPTRMLRLSNANEGLGSIDLGMINHRMGYASLSVIRSDLQRVLIAKLESLGVCIQYDHTVSGIESTHPGQARVHFQNGATVTADVVVGADGRMASRARQFVHGNNAPRYQGFINWIGVYESVNDSVEDSTIADYWGVGDRFGIVPVTKRKAYWAGGTPCADVVPGNEIEHKAALKAIFSDWPQPVRLMIDHTPVERISKIYVHDHDPILTWHRHNLIVIGDAAHAPLPTSGQGACQALEDAWHLANFLSDNPQNLERAFVEFTRIRFEKTAGIIMAARGFASSLFSRNEQLCRARNETSRSTDFAMVAAAMSRGWSQHLPLDAK